MPDFGLWPRGQDCVLDSGGGGCGGGVPLVSPRIASPGGLEEQSSRPVQVQVEVQVSVAACQARREAKAKPRLGQGWLTGKSGGKA